MLLKFFGVFAGLSCKAKISKIDGKFSFSTCPTASNLKKNLIDFLLGKNNDNLSLRTVNKSEKKSLDHSTFLKAIEKNIYNIKDLDILVYIYAFIPIEVRASACLTIINKLKECEGIFSQEMKADSLILLPKALESLQNLAIIGGHDAEVVKQLKCQESTLATLLLGDKMERSHVEDFSRLLEAASAIHSQPGLSPHSLTGAIQDIKLAQNLISKLKNLAANLEERKYSKNLNQFIFLSYNLIEQLSKTLRLHLDSITMNECLSDCSDILNELTKVFGYELQLDTDLLLLYTHFLSPKLEELESLSEEGSKYPRLREVTTAVERIWLTCIQKALERNVELPACILVDVWNKLIRTNFLQKGFVDISSEVNESKNIYAIARSLNLNDLFTSPQSEFWQSIADLYFKSILIVLSQADLLAVQLKPDFLSFTKTLCDTYYRVFLKQLTALKETKLLKKVVFFHLFNRRFGTLKHEDMGKLEKQIKLALTNHLTSAFFWEDDALIDILDGGKRLNLFDKDVFHKSLFYDSRTIFREYMEKKVSNKARISSKLVSAFLLICGEAPSSYPMLEDLLMQNLNLERLGINNIISIYCQTGAFKYFQNPQHVEIFEGYLMEQTKNSSLFKQIENPLAFIKFLLINRNQEPMRLRKILLYRSLALYMQRLTLSESNSLEFIQLAFVLASEFKRKPDDKKLAELLKSALTQFPESVDYHESLSKAALQLKILYQIALALQEQKIGEAVYYSMSDSKSELVCFDETRVLSRLRIEDDSVEKKISMILKKKDMKRELKNALAYWPSF